MLFKVFSVLLTYVDITYKRPQTNGRVWYLRLWFFEKTITLLSNLYFVYIIRIFLKNIADFIVQMRNIRTDNCHFCLYVNLVCDWLKGVLHCFRHHLLKDVDYQFACEAVRIGRWPKSSVLKKCAAREASTYIMSIVCLNSILYL